MNHSQWNPDRPLSGCIWDLIALPALHRPEDSIEKVLMLGFGAGAVARQLQELVSPGQIVGIDMDPIHLSIADSFFECAAGCELLRADAVEWVRSETGTARFDLIVDDLYSEEAGMPVRCAPMDLEWCRNLAGLLRPGGMLIFNLVEPEKIPHLPPLRDATLRRRFPHVRVFRIEGYENRIVAFSEKELSEACYRKQLREVCRRYPRCHGVGKRYRSFRP